MLFENGVIATLGKGKRSAVNRQMCQKYLCAYLVTPSGAAAALSQRVQSIRVVAYEELLSEAIQLITVRDFPMIVATDTTGEELFM
jgi:fumarate hydratase subunit beta